MTETKTPTSEDVLKAVNTLRRSMVPGERMDTVNRNLANAIEVFVRYMEACTEEMSRQ